MASAVSLQSALRGETLNVIATGSWIGAHAAALEPLIEGVRRDGRGRTLSVDMRGVDEIDTFGACLLERLIQSWKAEGKETTITGLSDRFGDLVAEVDHVSRSMSQAAAKRTSLDSLRAFGRAAMDLWLDTRNFLVVLGRLVAVFLVVLRHPKKMRFTSLVAQLDRVGLQAVPIILLITFLIGGIIAQQGLFNFRKFGADTYVVDLLAFLVLRELGVLIVAIMVAGRSGSSYTAEIGSMKMREEIDALRTMGLDPVEVLLLPRVLALVLALPMLTFLGFMAALYGGGVVSWIYGGMSPPIFIERIRDAASLTQFEVGLIKAPFMALVIGVIACTEGLAVQGSAESLGLRTTSSVVKSIFLIIVLDGILDLFFAATGM
ncbi:MlaE family lipid ABC transporter permease subunit [Beijerinckia indica]|uniref:STAS domain-containing protein n=1 Tax=Beijerinckia indica subsp. indica (strain ATCC 9039 / DSM 1715 / NCIMB 8712) TaxID=395963 RepID=B2IFF7_BEII9|nr:MlaE family lipid ABC transporter permease subunit [Beijerinckia indica]ACB97057.1 protein of unknown function DUF140 [Beijerinckia indica subsp. indica ATCC 9039]